MDGKRIKWLNRAVLVGLCAVFLLQYCYNLPGPLFLAALLLPTVCSWLVARAYRALPREQREQIWFPYKRHPVYVAVTCTALFFLFLLLQLWRLFG